ncbi:phage tail protein [Acidovorax sp. HDW3]|uniref:phage tail protein n=1 Tax=Acidovorax sp. HDW3 TaxID=2714923 RepID=UPI00140A43B4|nr:phage tail protein [Acidovorax sp. HDW3]QIL44638.1 phage tail protein [Acidovorax sp. HDW3]
MADMRMRLLIELKDRALAPLQRITQGSGKAAQALKDTQAQLKRLNEQQRTLDNMGSRRQALGDAAKKLRELKQQLQAMGAAGQASAKDMAAQQKAVDKASQAWRAQRQAVQALRRQLTTLGISNTAETQRNLGAAIERTNAAVARQEAAMRHAAKASQALQRAQQRGMGMTATGAGAYWAGRNALQAGAHGPMEQGKSAAMEEVRIRALGLQKEQADEAIAFARDFKSYGTSTLDNLQLMRDAVTVFNDTHHAKDALPFLAKMKAANEVVFGQEHAADNERKFMDMMKVIEMRNGANNREDFERNGNLVQQVITATGGRVGAEDWLHLIKTGGVAAKGLSEKEFFYRLEPLVQEMGGDRVGTGMMSAYQNLYQGRTTKRAAQMLDSLGLIADPSKVKHDKVGQISQLGVGALKGGEVFQRSQYEWLNTVLVPALAAKGITGEKEVLDAMGGIFSNRTAAALFATMYQQRQMIDKAYKLNASADNVDTLHQRAKGTASGAERDLSARKNDLYERLGAAVLPGYVKLLEVVTDVVEGLSNFAKANPGVTAAIGYTAAGIAGLMTTVGALLIPLGILLAKGALLRWVLSKIGLGLFGAGAAAQGASAGLGLWARMGAAIAGAWAWVKAGLGPLLARLGPMLASAWRAAVPMLLAAGRALLMLGQFLLATPLGLAITLLSTAAYLLYTRWQDIKGGAMALWQDMQALAGRMASAGADIVQGLVNGLGSGWAALRERVGSMADEVAATFKEKLGINSPSRVFMEYGGWIAQGAALGMEGGQAGVRAAALAIAGVAAGVATPAMGGMPMPAPLAGAAAQGSGQAGAASAAMAPAGGSSYQITINAAPGMDERALARAVAQELDKREQRGRSRVLSQLSDID